MNYLFIHQNFPAQYRHVVRHLASEVGNQIYFITQPNDNSMAGVYKVMYPKDKRGHINCHAYAVELDRAIHTGARVAEVCRGLLERGFRPDLIVGHSGWGETLFIKDVFPDVPLLANFEFYYHTRGVDVGFDPEFVSIFNDPARLRARNGINLMAFQGADWGHSATKWQRSLYPPEMQSRISVLHEGVDTDLACPKPRSSFTLPGSRRVLTRAAQSATARKRTLLVTIMQVSPKRSTSWPDSKVPATKAAEPAPRTTPYSNPGEGGRGRAAASSASASASMVTGPSAAACIRLRANSGQNPRAGK